MHLVNVGRLFGCLVCEFADWLGCGVGDFFCVPLCEPYVAGFLGCVAATESAFGAGEIDALWVSEAGFLH